MPLMRLKLIEHVRLKKVPGLFTRKWGDSIRYDLIAELTPYETSVKESVSVFFCDLRFMYSKRVDEISRWYVMQKSDRQELDASFKKFISDLKAEGWDVLEIANETKAFFDNQKKYLAYTFSRKTGRVTKEVDEKVLNNLLLDATIQRDD